MRDNNLFLKLRKLTSSDNFEELLEGESEDELNNLLENLTSNPGLASILYISAFLRHDKLNSKSNPDNSNKFLFEDERKYFFDYKDERYSMAV